MSWTGFPMTNGSDWARVDVFNQLVHAINERRAAVEFSSRVLFPTADDAQRHSIFRDLQRRLQAVVPAYDDPALHQYPPPSIPWQPMRWTMQTWRAAAGIHPDGFERRYPRTISSTDDPGETGQRAYLNELHAKYEHDGASWLIASDQAAPVDTIVEHGLADRGDYIGPWMNAINLSHNSAPQRALRSTGA